MTLNRKASTFLRFLAIFLGAVAIYWVALRPFHCAHVVQAVEVQVTRHFGTLRHDELVRAARENIARLHSVQAGCSTDVDLYIGLASNLSVLGQHDEALRYLKAAVKADTRPEIHFNIALTLLDLGRVDEAVSEMAVACEFNPWLLDRLEGEFKDRVKAEQERLIRIHARK